MKVDLVITVSKAYIDQTKEIAATLVHNGLELTNIYEFGVITGSIEKENIPNLRLPGIESITDEKTITISPPDETIQ